MHFTLDEKGVSVYTLRPKDKKSKKKEENENGYNKEIIL